MTYNESDHPRDASGKWTSAGVTNSYISPHGERPKFWGVRGKSNGTSNSQRGALHHLAGVNLFAQVALNKRTTADESRKLGLLAFKRSMGLRYPE